MKQQRSGARFAVFFSEILSLYSTAPCWRGEFGFRNSELNVNNLI
jgi:hypothetical protein